MSWKRALGALLSSVGLARGVSAQNPPARLPAVVVNATPDMPGPRRIAGVVRDTTGFPVEGVEISIPQLMLRATSSAVGAFRFENVKPGTYEVRARKLGFAPQVREVKVDTAGGALAFALLPISQALLPVVSVASRGGLSGVVGDTAFNPLPGAIVDVLGHAARATVDSFGQFYIPLRPGVYTVSISNAGFVFKIVSVKIPADSGRRITAYLTPASRKPSVLEAHNLEDFSSRLAWRTSSTSIVYTRDELIAKNIEWVSDGVQMGFGTFISNGPTLDRDCWAVKNGGPGAILLRDLTVDEIDMIEIYNTRPMPAQRTRSKTSRLALQHVPLSGTRDAGLSNRGKSCTTVYVWLR